MPVTDDRSDPRLTHGVDDYPVAMAFHKFLADLADNYRLGHLREWEGKREVDIPEEQERRGRILMLEELQTLQVADMHKLYGISQEAKGSVGNGSGVHQRPSGPVHTR